MDVRSVLGLSSGLPLRDKFGTEARLKESPALFVVQDSLLNWAANICQSSVQNFFCCTKQTVSAGVEYSLRHFLSVVELLLASSCSEQLQKYQLISLMVQKFYPICMRLYKFGGCRALQK